MSQRVDLVATLTAEAELAALDSRWVERIAWLEVRADLLGEVDLDGLRQRWAGGLLYTLRSEAEGGRFAGGPRERARSLIAAARVCDLVDLEADRDLEPEVLDAIPARQRLLSWHGPPQNESALAERFARMASVSARYYKLVPVVVRAGQEIAPLRWLKSLERSDVVAFAAGELGVWTRQVAAHLGAPLIYGSCAEREAAPGQPSVERLVLDYGPPRCSAPSRYFGIVGQPVAHSLSPRLHNGAYADLDIDACFLPFFAESFGDFWLEIVEGELFDELGSPLLGLSVTAPYKEAALAVAGASSPRAQALESANTLVRHEGVWGAESTDAEGVVAPLRARGLPLEVPALVVGSGGAGRAAALGLRDAGAEVTLANRTVERGAQVAARLEVDFVPLAKLELSQYQVVVHATALGHRPDDPLPFDPKQLARGAALVEMVYDLRPTPLLQAARDCELEVVDGLEVLLHQAVGQFRLMNGVGLPVERGARRLRGELVAGELALAGENES